ncbi:MAG: GDSL-type esterase/lipase family protein [Candidatus Cloacimonadaceae bacterium]|jgi:lysophospholipase L1-like esterase
MRRTLYFVFALILPCFVLTAAAESHLPLAQEPEIEIISEFPIEVDSLEEFIQSYYELLDNENYLKQFSFLSFEQNTISNMKPVEGFFQQLMKLRNGSQNPITIYQIGDSHIKPGYFSSTVRGALLNFFEDGTSVSEAKLKYYHTGINGASFQNLTPNDDIFERIRKLQPDLIIISLGTNDAQGNYDAKRFRAQMSGFMDRVFEQISKPKIIFTLPPDTYKRRRHNADVKKVCEEIKTYARENGFAWWDMYEVMGGDKSISKWRSNTLASKDMLHFSPKGYMLQGYLFYQAIMRSYQNLVGGSWQ